MKFNAVILVKFLYQLEFNKNKNTRSIIGLKVGLHYCYSSHLYDILFQIYLWHLLKIFSRLTGQ